MKEERDIKENKGRLSGEAEIDEALELLRQMEAVDKRRGYECVVRPVKLRLRRMRMWRRVASVAAVFATVAVGVGVWKTSEPVDMPVTVATIDSIVPGRPTARLVLADRREVLLDTLSSGRVAQSSGVAIRKEGEKVIYEASSEKSASRVEYNELLVPRGGEYDIVLEDGTRVWMNSDSELRYPSRFEGGERRVSVTGEAYFQVAKDESLPFIVEAGGAAVRVTGTEFNVMAYPDDGRVETTLVSGGVDVEANGQTRRVAPGSQAVYDKATGGLAVRAVDLALYTSWKDGLFEFRDMPLGAVARQLERWYDVEILFADPAVADIRFTGAVKKMKPLAFILDIIQGTRSVDYRIEGRQVIIDKK